MILSSIIAFSESNIKSNYEKKARKIIINNTKVYYKLIDDIISLTKNIIGNSYSLNDKKQFRNKIIAKKRLFYFIHKQITTFSLDEKTMNPAYDIYISTDVICKSCNGKGCDKCGDDGYGYSLSDNPTLCGKCDGKGSFAGRVCPGCDGLGWANSFPDPKY